MKIYNSKHVFVGWIIFIETKNEDMKQSSKAINVAFHPERLLSGLFD